MLNNDSYILTRYVRLSLSILSLLFGSAYNVNHNINNGFFKQTKKTQQTKHKQHNDATGSAKRIFAGIPLTIQSARPSSRSSQRSSGSIGSYGNRRPSSAPLHGSKGVLVSTSRTGAARSAAILLVSCHISALRSSRSNTSQHPSDHLSDDNMTRYLERQLEHQKQLLFLDIPSLRNHNKLLSKFCKTTKYASSSNDDSSYDDEPDDNGVNHYSYENDSVEMGALPTPASEVANVAVNSPILHHT